MQPPTTDHVTTASAGDGVTLSTLPVLVLPPATTTAVHTSTSTTTTTMNTASMVVINPSLTHTITHDQLPYSLKLPYYYSL